MTERNPYLEKKDSGSQTEREVDTGHVNLGLEENSSYEPVVPQGQRTIESPEHIIQETVNQTPKLPTATRSSATERSIRCLKVLSAVLVVIIILMAAASGYLMSEQIKRLNSIEGKTDLLHSEMDHIRAENNSVVIQSLDFKITQMESDLKSIAAAFKNCTAESTHLKMRVIQLESDRRNDLATLQNYYMRTTELETKSNSYSERIGEHSSRISALEGLPMIGFTAIGRKNHLNGALIYDSILSKVGGGFDTSTGVFTCPVAGLYLVSMMLQVEFDGHINCWLYKNGAKTSLEIDINGNGQELASQTAVFKLSKGNSLYVGSCDEGIVGDETTFTVVLIQADT